MVQFRKWASSGDRQEIQFNAVDQHFDWWTFPLPQWSRGYGDGYNITGVEETLKKDPKFMKDYLEAVDLYMQSLGWDINKGTKIETQAITIALDVRL